MTLSQIIAKDPYMDEEIPSEGKWKVFLVIQDGEIELMDVTKQKAMTPAVAKRVCDRELGR